MKQNRVSLPALMVSAAMALSVPVGSLAETVNVQTHTAPANSVYMLNETGGLRNRGPLFLALDYNVLNDPLVELTPDLSQRLSTLVDSIHTLEITAGYEILRVLSLNVTVPLNLVHQTDQPRFFGLGDTRIFAKIPLVSRDAPIQLSVVPELRLPTGDGSLFVSDGQVGYGALFAAERRFRFFSLVANLGYRRSPGATFRDVDYRQKLPVALGAGVPLGSRWTINGELAGARILPFNSSQNPGEVYLGARFQVTESAVLHGGASLGSTSSTPSGDYRVLFGLKIEPKAVKSDAVPSMMTSPYVKTGTEAGSVSTVASGRGAEVTDTLRSRQGQRVVLTPKKIEIGQEIRFEHNSDRLMPDSQKLLDDVAAMIVENRDHIGKIDVEGHCNELGGDLYNLKLSQKRADSVRRYLVSRAVSEDKLESIGYGKRRPKAGSEKLIRDVRLKVNRRVEFKMEDQPAENPGTG